MIHSLQGWICLLAEGKESGTVKWIQAAEVGTEPVSCGGPKEASVVEEGNSGKASPGAHATAKPIQFDMFAKQEVGDSGQLSELVATAIFPASSPKNSCICN